MRTIAHISDLHFGAEDPPVVAALERDLLALAPDLLVVSGDVTQRARPAEFIAARDFLARLPMPRLAVPGNHDVPLYDWCRRLASPFGRWRAYICDDLQPSWGDDEVVVLGMTTPRILSWKNGRLSRRQIGSIRSVMCGDTRDRFRILVTHHQFIPHHERPDKRLVGRATLALAELEDCGVDLLLAGHLHLGFTGDTAAHHESVRRSILVAQAGTAVSRRRRGEANAYNAIAIDGDLLTITVRAWQQGEFVPVDVNRFRKRLGEWKQLL